MPSRHCIVTPEYSWPALAAVGAAVGEHCRQLAAFLVAEGCAVTVLYTGPGTTSSELPNAGLSDAVTGEDGIEFVIPPHLPTAPHAWPKSIATQMSQRVARYLEDHEFDGIHFQDRGGHGFRPLQARRTLGALFQAKVMITLHGGTERRMEEAGLFPEGSVENMVSAFAERYAVQHADVAILPTADAGDWAIRHGWELPPARVVLPLFSASDNTEERKQKGSQWQDLMRQRLPIPPEAGVSQRPGPISIPSSAKPVTVCMAHYNHAAYLGEALASLACQTSDAFTVVIVDDGSTDEGAVSNFEELAKVYSGRGWHFVRQENRGVCNARNHAASLAGTDYLLFMDSDNLAAPAMISTFLQAVNHSGLDAISCFYHAFEDGVDPHSGVFNAEYIPVGACLEGGMLANVFGDTNFIIRTAVFRALGGFSEDRKSSFEDWEFLAHLVLSGYRLDVVPLYLLLYRHVSTSSSRTLSLHASNMRALRPYLFSMPDWQQRAVKGWFGSNGMSGPDLRERIDYLESRVMRLQGKIEQLKSLRQEDKARWEKSQARIARLKKKESGRTTLGRRIRRLLFPWKSDDRAIP